MPSRSGTPAACLMPLPGEVPRFELQEDPLFWEDSNIKVIVRVRPLNHAERNQHSSTRCLQQMDAKSVVWLGQTKTNFTFDHVACEATDQEEIFRVTGLPIVEKFMAGHNTCVFAYGQTGCGKTYTMLGQTSDSEVKPNPNRGMIPRVFELLFSRIREEEESRANENVKYSCRCSFLEIYNEQITDLLNPTSTNLPVREDIRKGVYVENLTEFEVSCASDIVNLLVKGSENRKVAATIVNPESSRSHSIFTCIIESEWEKDSTPHFRSAKLNLVDLAGSERTITSGAEGERLKETSNINRSLSTLGLVVRNLVARAHGKQRHIPYRNSRLTFLLQDSLGGNSKTMIIANISPSAGCASETSKTLKFAREAMCVQNKAFLKECSMNPEPGLSLGGQPSTEALQLELDILKTILSEEATSHKELEELLKMKDLEISELNARNEQILSEEATSRKELEELLKMKDLEISELNARNEQVSQEAAKEIVVLERTVVDLQTTVCALEEKKAELEEELQKVRTRSRSSELEDATVAFTECSEHAIERRIRRKWSSEEEAALRQGVQKHGPGQWRLILLDNPDAFSGRTGVDLKDKWRNMMEKEKNTHE